MAISVQVQPVPNLVPSVGLPCPLRGEAQGSGCAQTAALLRGARVGGLVYSSFYNKNTIGWVSSKHQKYTGSGTNNDPFYYKIFYYKIISM